MPGDHAFRCAVIDEDAGLDGLPAQHRLFAGRAGRAHGRSTGLAWAADGETLFYVTEDPDTKRPCRLWRRRRTGRHGDAGGGLRTAGIRHRAGFGARQSGHRAGMAIDWMTQNGFTGTLTNAGSVADAAVATGMVIQ